MCNTGSGGGGDGEASTSSASQDFNTEYAKSGKSMCRGCDDNIGKVCWVNCSLLSGSKFMGGNNICWN